MKEELRFLEPVTPTRPIAPYIGGKRRLAPRLVKLIGETPHRLFADVFGGMGGVFFRRDRRPRVEVINDISGDIVALFRVLQRHYLALLDTLKWQLASRADFERFLRLDPTTLTDIERAARFLFLQRMSFGGKVMSRVFGVDKNTPARFDLSKLGPMLEKMHARLEGVVIERLPFGDLIPRYDRAGALFYCDPPYLGHECDYGRGVFSPDDFARLRDILRAIKGRFILSINDHPAIRELFKGFAMQEAELVYSTGGFALPARELIIVGGGAAR